MCTKYGCNLRMPVVRLTVQSTWAAIVNSVPPECIRLIDEEVDYISKHDDGDAPMIHTINVFSPFSGAASLAFDCKKSCVDYTAMVDVGATRSQIERAIAYNDAFNRYNAKEIPVYVCAYDMSNGNAARKATNSSNENMKQITGIWQIKVIAFNTEYSYGTDQRVTEEPLDEVIKDIDHMRKYIQIKKECIQASAYGNPSTFESYELGAPCVTPFAFQAYLSALKAGSYADDRRNYDGFDNNSRDFAHDILTFLLQETAPVLERFKKEEVLCRPAANNFNEMSLLMEIVAGHQFDAPAGAASTALALRDIGVDVGIYTMTTVSGAYQQACTGAAGYTRWLATVLNKIALGASNAATALQTPDIVKRATAGAINQASGIARSNKRGYFMMTELVCTIRESAKKFKREYDDKTLDKKFRSSELDVESAANKARAAKYGPVFSNVYSGPPSGAAAAGSASSAPSAGSVSVHDLALGDDDDMHDVDPQ
jgi:hypothetical protein